jgi:arylsulfatase A-like enzyme
MRVKLWRVRSASRGFALGASLGLLAHLVNVWGTSAAAHDDATRRVTAELLRLGHETTAFFVALAIAVALAAGLAGAIVGAVWHFAAWRRAWAAVPAALALLILRAFLCQPALLEPSLGGAQGILAPALQRAATWLSPWMIDALIVGVAAWGLRRRPRALAALAALLVLLWMPRLWTRTRGAKLLVLAVDSLRPDKLAAAPHLRSLQARGVSFDVALSPMASTTPAWISLLTGRYPHTHGVRNMFPRRELRADWLDSLPRRLTAAGVRTSVVSDYAGDFFPLFQLGFERQKVSPPLTLGLVFQREVVTHSAPALALLNHGLGQLAFPVFRFLMTNADPERLADEVLDEMRDHTAVVAFFSTTHVPFAAPWPWYRKYASPAYGGAHRYLYDVQKLGDVTASDVRLPERDVEQVRRLYDGSVAAVDAAIGRLLEQVDEHTLVVLLADHGENLFEPGNTTFHGKWFRGGDEANRVPLVIAGPGISPHRVPEPVSLVDVAPTLLELLGLPAGGFDGVSLAPALASGHAPAHDVFAETAIWLAGPPESDGVRYPALPQLLEADPQDRFQLVLKTRYEDIEVEAKHRMLRRGSSKLIYVPISNGVRWQLYDMEADPHQQHELPASKELMQAMRKFLQRDPERELDAREHVVRRTED